MNEDYPWRQDPEDDMEELEEKAPGEEIMEDTNPPEESRPILREQKLFFYVILK